MLIDTLEPEKRSDAEDDESEEEVVPEVVFTEKWIRVKQKLEFINPREYPVAAIKLLWNGKTMQDEDYIKDTPGIRDESSVWAEIDQEVIEMLRRKQKENPNRCYICRTLITHHYTDVPINKSLMGLVNEYKSLSKVFGEW